MTPKDSPYKLIQRVFDARYEASQRMPHDPMRPTFKKLGRAEWKARQVVAKAAA